MKFKSKITPIWGLVYSIIALQQLFETSKLVYSTTVYTNKWPQIHNEFPRPGHIFRHGIYSKNSNNSYFNDITQNLIKDLPYQIRNTTETCRNAVNQGLQAVKDSGKKLGKGILPKTHLQRRIFAGAIARVIVQLILYPLETKRKLINLGFDANSIISMYNGFFPAIIFGEVPYSALCTYVQTKTHQILQDYETHIPEVLKPLVASLVADGSALAYKTPFDVCKNYTQSRKADSYHEAAKLLLSKKSDVISAYSIQPIQMLRDTTFRFMNIACIKNLRICINEFSSINDVTYFIQAIFTSSTKKIKTIALDVGRAMGMYERPLERILRKLYKIRGSKDLQDFLKDFSSFCYSETAGKVGQFQETCTLSIKYLHLKFQKCKNTANKSCYRRITESALVGGISGIFCTFVIAPIDAFKAYSIKSIADAKSLRDYGINVYQTIRSQGISGLYNGASQRAPMAGLCNAIGLIVVENLMNALKQDK